MSRSLPAPTSIAPFASTVGASTVGIAFAGALLALAVLAGVDRAAAQQPVRSTATSPNLNFESGPVRPLLLSADGGELYVLNTSDHRLELYAVGTAPDGGPALSYLDAVFTGLEPVSMALHPSDPDRLFVVNLLSDSLAVVSVSQRRVLATVPVGDEPSDVVVVDGQVAVASARAPSAPDLLAPSGWIENAVVFLDAEPPYAVLDRVSIPGFKPRALVAADGVVHVVPLVSGNHTTTLDAADVSDLGMDQFDLDAFDPAFPFNAGLLSPELSTGGFDNNPFGANGWELPRTGRLVFDFEYPSLVPQLADVDVHRVDTATHALLPGGTPGVGTTLLAMARNPVTGELWVANTDARNRQRFEPAISGAAMDNRVTIVGADGSVTGVIQLAPPLTSGEHAQPVALAFHQGGAGASDAAGDIAYVAALGTATVIALDAHSGALVAEIPTAPLPIGLAVDDARQWLYVYTLSDKTVRGYRIDAGHMAAGRPRALAYDAEPAAVSTGRVHLYDARVATGAGTGNFSCASCHTFGHMDGLAWDLGNPEGGLGNFYADLMTGELSFDNDKLAQKQSSMTHPMKGPMVTQSLRGLGDAKGPPLHWRGDRRFVQMFRGAFVGLLGGSGISSLAMQEYAGFLRSLVFPPNPYERRDRQYEGQQAQGADLFGMNPALSGKTYNPLVPGLSCIDCHEGNFFDGSDYTGSQRTVNFDGPEQLFNTAGLRGVYEKEFLELTGFGASHDGALDGVRGFLDGSLGGVEAFPALTSNEKDAVTAFVRAWDTGLSPLVGAQHTTAPNAPNLSAWLAFLDLAEAQARPPASNVDLVGKLHVTLPGGQLVRVGVEYALDPADGQWRYHADVDRWVERSLIETLVFLGVADGSFTCVPPGWGTRLGVDRDEDGLLDGLEALAGTMPFNPDTDGDGYDDALELTLGGKPGTPDAFLAGDVSAPTVTSAAVNDVFADAASVHLLLDEAGDARVDVGSAPGSYDLTSAQTAELRRVHDLHLTGLPAGTELFFRATVSDRNGNASTHEGSFTTAPPLFHLTDMTLSAEGRGPYTLTCHVTVVDQAGEPVPDLPVKLLWAGDLAGEDFFPAPESTDAAGVSTHVFGPFTPAGPTTITATVVFLGTNVTGAPFFIGFGGDDPSFFYNQSANAVSYVSVLLP